MYRRLAIVSMLATLACAALPAQSTLTNESVLKLVKGGIGEDVIVGMIKSQICKFSLEPADLITLKSEGVSDKVMSAMVGKSAGDSAAAPDATKAAPPATTKEGLVLPDELGVYHLQDGKLVSVPPEILNLRTARGGQFVFGLAAKAKLNGWVTKQHSQTHVTPEVQFVVKLPEGTDPAEYACLGFNVKNDRREVELARGRINFSTGTHRSAVPFTSEKLAKQVYRVKFDSPLKAGEYGLLPPGAQIAANATSAGKIYTFLVE